MTVANAGLLGRRPEPLAKKGKKILRSLPTPWLCFERAMPSFCRTSHRWGDIDDEGALMVSSTAAHAEPETGSGGRKSDAALAASMTMVLDDDN